MKPRRTSTQAKAWAVVLSVITAIGVFLTDSLAVALVGESNGSVSVIYPGTKIKSALCREVGVALASGQVVLATVADGSIHQCQIGAPVVVKHLRTRLLHLSSYESVLANGAGL